MICPVATFNARTARWCRDGRNRGCRVRPDRVHRENRLGAVEGLNLALFVDGQHDSLLRRREVQPDDITNLFDEERVGRELERLGEWGLSPKVCQIRTMALGDRPSSRAKERVLQWVASAGRDSRVRVTAASTCRSVIVGGAPGRGSSASPSRRRSETRSRHLRTVGKVTCRSAAMVALACPSAAARMIRERSARRWAVLGSACPLGQLGTLVIGQGDGCGLGSAGHRELLQGFPTPIDRLAETGNELLTQDARELP